MSKTALELPPEIDGFLSRHLGFQSLLYQCGHQMWCKGCRQCLDANNAVSLDVYSVAAGKLLSTVALCGSCFDSLDLERARSNAEAAAKEPCRLETFDGRELDADGFPLGVKLDGAGLVFQARRRKGNSGPYSWTSVTGRKVEFAGYEDFGFAVYADGDGRWFCVELTTGAALGHGSSAKGAACRAMQSLVKHGRAKFVSAMARAK